MARGTHPEDAYRGLVNPMPADADEAVADRELADAERAVVHHTATDEQRTRVLASGEVRSHEERRERWMASHASDGSPGGRDHRR